MEQICVLTCNISSQSYCNVFGNMTADSQWAEWYFYTILGQTVIETPIFLHVHLHM